MGAAAAAPIGAALGALVAADAPAFEELDVSCCSMIDSALGPLCDALAHNTHLRKLALVYNNMSAACAAQRLLPGVRANASLRELDALEDDRPDDADALDAYEHSAAAVQLVEAREAARVAAEAAAAAGNA
jgi:hypothetical protein